MLDPKFEWKLIEVLEEIAAAIKTQNELLLSITYSKAGEAIRDANGKINVRFIRGIPEE